MIEVTEHRYLYNTVPELTQYLPLYDFSAEEKNLNQIREQCLALLYGWA